MKCFLEPCRCSTFRIIKITFYVCLERESEQKGTVLISHLSGSEFSHNFWIFHPSRSPAAASKSFSNAHENLVFMHKACSIVKKLPLIIKSEIGLDSLQKQKKFPSKKKTIKHHRTWQCRVEVEAKRDKKKTEKTSFKAPRKLNFISRVADNNLC